MRAIVVGGGISGLAAAWELCSQGAEVTLVEGSSRLGGKIASAPFAGIDLETGPDSFLARVPAAVDLATSAGLSDELVAPGTGQAFLWARGRLRPLPAGLVLGVPSDIGALARNGVLPPLSALRAGLDLVLPGRPLTAPDVSVGALIRRRMGRGAQMRLIDPLLGGINAGHTDALSAAVAAPQLLAAARRDRSLIRGLRAAPVAAASGPVFLTVRSGLGRLVDALAQRPTVVMGDPVVGVAPGWQATLRSGRTLTADAVVLACPAAAAATLLAPIAPTPAATLNEIRMTSVVLTTLAYAARDVTGSGFLVPRPEGRLISAATWVGSKWPHLATPGRLVIRASSGRSDDTRAMEMADGDLIDALHQELTAAMGLTDKRPIEATVHRWPEAFPQFDVGHLSRIEAVENALPPGLALAGAYLRGVGLATCIAGARAAAQQLCDT